MDKASRRDILSRIGAVALGLGALPSEAADDVTLAGKAVAPGSKLFGADVREFAIETAGATAPQTVKFCGAPLVVRL